jgi:hypothetical protein
MHHLYFFVLEQAFLVEVMGPALTRSYRQRSYAPCQDLCGWLLARTPAIPQDAVVRALGEGLPFDRLFWHSLIGECLVYGARDIPRMHLSPDSLCCLLAPDCLTDPDVPRSRFAPIQQVLFGSCDVAFAGGYYRPDHAGLNDRGDVARLAEYLESVDTAIWSPRDLTPLAEYTSADECAEELAYVRDWWPSLVELYQRARANGDVLVCEQA